MLLLAAFALLAQDAEIRYSAGVIRVTPGAGGTVEVFASDAADAPAVLGSTRMEGEALLFEPRFPLRPGIRCRVIFRSAVGIETRHQFTVPEAAARAAARLEQVYPTGDTMPENQLKLYLHFSAPMARGEAYRHIRLLEESSGAAVELPFLELDQELWDASGKRLTVFFDPGRVKRDVLPNREVGLPMVAGKRYTLVIDSQWPDAHGSPLAREFRKSFLVTAADRAKPTVSTWRIEPPRPGTRDPLVIDLGEPFDHALLVRDLNVAGVKGEAGVDRHETRWLFTPAEPWKRGAYEITAATALEDLAGNRLDRLFDVDKFDRVDKNPRRETRRLRFTVR